MYHPVGISCKECAVKEVGACFRMTCLQANHQRSANSIRKDSVPTELTAGMNC